MHRLGLPVTEAPGSLTVTPPSWRFDLTIEEDLIEEVVRVLGYERLPDTPPLAPVTARVRPEAQRGSHAVRHALAALDYQETINFSFVEERWEHELAGNAGPDQGAQPHCGTLGGDALQPAGQPGGCAASTTLPARRRGCGCSSSAGYSSRDAGVASTDRSVAGVAQPMRVAALAQGPAVGRCSGRCLKQAVDFFDLKGDLQTLLAPQQVAMFRCGGASGHAPGPLCGGSSWRCDHRPPG